jgi:hypothetical protein
MARSPPAFLSDAVLAFDTASVPESLSLSLPTRAHGMSIVARASSTFVVTGIGSLW